MAKGRLIPGPPIPAQPDRLVWVALLQQPGEDGLSFMQKLEDMDHETRCLMSGDLMAESRRVWAVQSGSEMVEGLQLMRIFQTSDAQFQKTMRDVDGVSVN